MVMKTETITDSGVVIFSNLTRYEHHKVTINVSNYSADIVFTVNDIGNINNNEINLDELNRTFTLTENGSESYLVENTRLEKININVSSGGGTIKIDYEGW